MKKKLTKDATNRKMALSSKLLYLCGKMFGLEWVKIMVGIALLQNLLLFMYMKAHVILLIFILGNFIFPF